MQPQSNYDVPQLHCRYPSGARLQSRCCRHRAARPQIASHLSSLLRPMLVHVFIYIVLINTIPKCHCFRIYIAPTSRLSSFNEFFVPFTLLSLTPNFLFDKPVRNGGIFIKLKSVKHSTNSTYHKTTKHVFLFIRRMTDGSTNEMSK